MNSGRSETLIFVGFMSVLVWAPLPFASNRIWAAALLAVLLSVLLAGWLILYCLGRVKIEAAVWRHARWPLFLLIAIQLWVYLQVVPLPPWIVAELSPQAFAWHIRPDWLTLSLDPEAGKYYLLKGFSYTAGFFLALALVNSHNRVKTFLQVLILSGTFQASYGAFMVLSGLELGFFVEKYVGQGVATGTFVNRNHLAAYLVMCMSAGIGLLLAQMSHQQGRSWKERVRGWLRFLLSPKIRLRIYLAVMAVALVLTRSRMGNIAFFSALSVAGIVAIFAGRRFSIRMALLLASLFVVDVLILGRWFGLDKLMQRLQETNPGAESRVWSNVYTLDYLEKFPLAGSGGGSFYGVFPNFQGPTLDGYHLHAHNDYLEFGVELGIPAVLALAGLVGLTLFHAVAVQRLRRTALYRGAGFAVTMTITWMVIHSFTDFNLQIPANALTFVAILALAYICRGLPGNSVSRKTSNL